MKITRTQLDQAIEHNILSNLNSCFRVLPGERQIVTEYLNLQNKKLEYTFELI